MDPDAFEEEGTPDSGDEVVGPDDGGTHKKNGKAHRSGKEHKV